MANVQHSALTDPELHEPKDISTASSGEVYVADGSASGAWGLAETIEATKDVTGTDGYVKLPGGVILQWGTITTTDDNDITITFPTAFPTACINVVFSMKTANNNNYGAFLYNYTTTTFTFNRSNNLDGTSVFTWQAIGY